MTTHCNDYEAGRQLRKDHGCWRDRVEDRYGAGAPAEGIQHVAPGQEQEYDQPRADASHPTGRAHELSVTYLTRGCCC